MLSEYEQQQLAGIEARLIAEAPRLLAASSERSDRGWRRARDRRVAGLLAAGGAVVLVAGLVLSPDALILIGSVMLYLAMPCWFFQDLRSAWAPRRSSGTDNA